MLFGLYQPAFPGRPTPATIRHMAERKFQIRATDEQGDTWTYGTDDPERARDMLEQMRDDFETVEVIAGEVSGY